MTNFADSRENRRPVVRGARSVQILMTCCMRQGPVVVVWQPNNAKMETEIACEKYRLISRYVKLHIGEKQAAASSSTAYNLSMK